jgi:hypothetical protein
MLPCQKGYLYYNEKKIKQEKIVSKINEQGKYLAWPYFGRIPRSYLMEQKILIDNKVDAVQLFY